MRKTKKLVTILLVILLMGAMVFAAVSCKPEVTPPPAEEALSDVISKYIDGMNKTYLYDNKQNLGWDFDADIEVNDTSFNISTRGVIDNVDASKCKFELVVTDLNNEVEAFRISADDKNLYFSSPSAKHCFTGFEFASMIQGNVADANATVQSFSGIFQALFSIVFTDFTQSDGLYTLNGNLSSLMGLVNTLVGELGEIGGIVEIVVGIIPELNVSLEFSIVNEKIATSSLMLSGDDISLYANLNKAEFLNSNLPVIEVPEKSDANYPHTQLGNFTMEGSFSFIEKANDYTRKTVAYYDWSLRVDVNPFDILRNVLKTDADGNMAGLKGLFQSKQSKFHFVVSHKCSADCDTYCNTGVTKKMGSARGAIIDIAYDNTKTDNGFNNNKINLAINPKYILPSGLLNLLGDLPIDISAMLPEYLALNINPEILFSLSEVNSELATVADATDLLGGLDFGSILNFLGGLDYSQNLLNIIFNVVDILKSATFTTTEGLTIGTTAITDLVENFDPTIANIVNMFFGNADYMNINVPTFKFADVENNDYDVYENFMMIDKNIGELKSFINGKDDYTPSKNVEWTYDKNGNIKISGMEYDANGDPLPISAQEAYKILNEGGVHYSFTDMLGNKDNDQAKIIKVIGLDYNKFDVPQEVTLVTGMTDGGAVSNLLNLISALGPMLGLDLNLEIPGDVVKTKITLTKALSVDFYQEDSISDENKLNTDRLYKYKENIGIGMSFKITYDKKDAETGKNYVKSMTGNTLRPKDVGAYIYNYGSGVGQIETFADFDLVYEAYGFEKVYNIKTDPTQKSSLVGDILGKGETSIGLNSYVTMSSSLKMQVSYTDGGVEKTTSSIYNNTIGKLLLTPQENMVIEIVGKDTKFKFTQYGRYTVKGTYVGVPFEKDYIVEKPVVLPKYNITTNFTDLDVIRVAVSRGDQLGKGLNVKFGVSVSVNGGEKITLNDEQFEVGTLNNEGEFVKLDKIFFNKFIIGETYFYIKINDKDMVSKDLFYSKATVTAYATDAEYKNAVISESTNNPIAGYSLALGDIQKATGEYSGDAMELITVSGAPIKGLEVGFVVRVTLSDGTVKTLNAVEYDLLTLTKWGSMVIWSPFDGSFSYGSSNAYIHIKPINGATINSYSISIVATNYDNTVINTAIKSLA